MTFRPTPLGASFWTSASFSITASATATSLAPRCLPTLTKRASFPLKAAPLSRSSKPSSTRARSRSRITRPSRTSTGREASSSTVPYSPVRRSSRSCRPVFTLPAGSSTCLSSRASEISETVSPRASSLAGSSQIRISRFRRPGVSTLPTPLTAWRRALRTLSTKKDFSR